MKLKRRFSKIWLIFPFVFLILISFGALKSNLLNIDQVNVDTGGAGCLSIDLIKSELDLEKKKIWQIDPEEINDLLVDIYPCVESVTTRKYFPKRVDITLKNRESLIRVGSFLPKKTLDFENLEASSSSSSALIDWNFPDSKDHLFSIDKSGRIFQYGSGDDNLPVIFIPLEELKIGQNISNISFENISQIIEKLDQLILISYLKNPKNAINGKVEEEFLLLNLEPKLIFDLSSDVNHQLASLQLILKVAKIDQRPIKYIDLRFNKPVVVYDPQKKS